MITRVLFRHRIDAHAWNTITVYSRISPLEGNLEFTVGGLTNKSLYSCPKFIAIYKTIEYCMVCHLRLS